MQCVSLLCAGERGPPCRVRVLQELGSKGASAEGFLEHVTSPPSKKEEKEIQAKQGSSVGSGQEVRTIPGTGAGAAWGRSAQLEDRSGAAVRETNALPTVPAVPRGPQGASEGCAELRVGEGPSGAGVLPLPPSSDTVNTFPSACTL